MSRALAISGAVRNLCLVAVAGVLGGPAAAVADPPFPRSEIRLTNRHHIPTAGRVGASVLRPASEWRPEATGARYRRAKDAANRSSSSLRVAMAVTAGLKGRATPAADAASSLFLGLGFPGQDDSICECDPADAQVAVGPADVVEMVNTGVSIWTRNGVHRATFPLDQIVGGRNRDLTDPQVLYDALSGRWFAAAMDVAHNGTEVAVSDGADPIQSWTSYTMYYTSADCPDQPRLGVSDAVVAVTTELFSGDCRAKGVTSVEGGVITVISKQDLLGAANTPATADYGPSADYSNFVPVQSLSPAPIQYFAAAQTPSASALRVVEYVGAPPGSAFGATDTFLLTALNTPPNAPQRGTGTRLDTGDDRLSDASFLNGIIYLAANDACDDGTTVTKSCARLMEVSVADHRLLGEVDIGFRGGYAFYTALRPDASGNVIAVVGYSSSRLYPSVGVIGVRGPVSGENGADLTDLQALASGTDEDLNREGRWGDYDGSALDPVNPSVVWTVGQVGDTAGKAGWGTHIDAASLVSAAVPQMAAHQVLPGYTYRGRTPQRQPIRVRTSGSGRRVIRVTGRIRAHCRDGYRDEFSYRLLSGSDSRLIRANGRFNATVRLGSDSFAKHSTFRVAGTVFSDRMLGTLSMVERSRHHGGCRATRARWHAS